MIWDPGAHETSLKCNDMDIPTTTNTHKQNKHQQHIFKLQDQPRNHAVYIVTENQYTINQDSGVMSFEYNVFVDFFIANLVYFWFGCCSFLVRFGLDLLT